MAESTSTVPTLFLEVLEECNLLENADGMVSDAFGLAEEPHFHSRSLFAHVTKENVIRELAELDYYEKVSLAFLLCDDVAYILERLMIAERARLLGSLTPVDILTEWLQIQKIGKWEKKMVEALCIIQNYQVLERLRCDPQTMRDIFLPRSPESSLHVSCLRKALYHMCENLTPTRLEDLLERVCDDYEALNTGQRLQKFDVEFMEINVLYWSSLNYINLGGRNGRGVDIHKLKTILKRMDETTLLDNLESSERVTVNASVCYPASVSSFTDTTSSTSSMSVRSISTESDQSTVSQRTSMSQHSVASTKVQMKQTLNQYRIDPDNVGVCLIINQKNFYKDFKFKNLLPPEDLQTRLGTDLDRERLVEVFMSMGFSVITKDNLTHTEILAELDDVLRSEFKKEHSCFILCIMSHGMQGVVFGVDSVPVSEEDLKIVMMRHDKLWYKPKMLFIQACQGKEQQEALVHDSDIAEDGLKGCSPSLDYLTCWSTVPGYASFRNEIEGTWFVRALHQHFLCSRDSDDIYMLLTSVNNAIGSQTLHKEGKLRTMVSVFSSTLSSRLMLPLQRIKRQDVSMHLLQRQAFNHLISEYISSRMVKTMKKSGIKYCI